MTAQPVDSTTRRCCGSIGDHAPDCHLREGIDGRWLGERGIFRHWHPTTVSALRESESCGQPVSHVMSTAVSGRFSGDVVGKLIRWVDAEDKSVIYEAQIDGTPDSAGLSDIAAYFFDDICAVAKVANDIRYEWAAILEGQR